MNKIVDIECVKKTISILIIFIFLLSSNINLYPDSNSYIVPKILFFGLSIILLIPFLFYSKTSFKVTLSSIDVILILISTLILLSIFFSTKPLNILHVLYTFCSIIVYIYFRFKFSYIKQESLLNFNTLSIIIIFILLVLSFTNETLNNAPISHFRFSNSGHFSNFLASIFPFFLLSFLNSEKKKFNFSIDLLNFLILVIITYVVFVTTSRASQLAIIICISLVLVRNFHFFSFIKQCSKYKKITLFSLLLSLFIFILLFIYIQKKDSADGRLFIWKTSLSLIKPGNFLFGTGFNTFEKVYNNIQENYFRIGRFSATEIHNAKHIEHAYNEYLQIFIEYGFIVTILIFIILFKIIALFLEKNQKNNISISALVVISISVISFFFYSLYLPIIRLILLINLAFLSSTLPPNSLSQKINFNTKSFKTILIVLTSILFIKFYSIQRSFHIWKTQSLYKSNISSSIYNYNAHYSNLSWDLSFVSELSDLFLNSKQVNESLLILKKIENFSSDPFLFQRISNVYNKKKDFRSAEKYLLKSHFQTPNNFYPMFLLMNFYISRKDTQNSKLFAEKIINHKIKIPSKAVSDIKDSADYHLKYLKNKSFK